jgi:ribosomal protein S18 acetylase RimI-like enzyme
MIYTFNMVIPGDPVDCQRTEISTIISNKIIGHLSLDIFKEDKYTAITWVYVDPEYRKCGIATDLLNEAWNITREHGLKTMGLTVDKSSKQEYLIKFYEEKGFKFDEVTESGGITMYKMEE